MQFLNAGFLPLVDFEITVFLGIICVVTQSWQLALMFVAFGGLFACVSRGLFRQQNQAQTTFIQIDDKQKAFFNDFLANGAEKNTLLKLILNELQPTTGKIEIQGVPAKSLFSIF